MIEDLGESLLGKQRENIAARDSSRKKQARQLQNEKILGLGGALLGKALMTDAQKKANGFMQREPIMAARAKYNAGVSQSIALIKEGELADAHAQGVQGYLRDKALPQFKAQLARAMPNYKNYTKAGIDAYAYEQADTWAKNNTTTFKTAREAAYRVGNDSTAFDNFIKVNDGIADSPLGALGKSIAGMFKGKSEPALQTSIETSLISSRYIKDVDALQAARQALYSGVPVGDAQKIAKSMEQYKITDANFTVTNTEDTTKTIKRFGKEFTVEGTETTKEDDWGNKRTTFTPNESIPELDKQTMPKKTSTQVVINGMRYDRVISQQYDIYDNPVGVPTTKDVALGPALAGSSSVTKAESLAIAEGFRQNLATYQSGLGVDFNDFSDGYAEYVLRDTEASNEDLVASLYEAAYGNMVFNAAEIQAATETTKYKNNSKDLSTTISQHIVLNDMSRMAEGGTFIDNPLGVAEDNFEFSQSVKQAKPTSLEILESIGSIKKSGSANVDAQYILDVATSTALFEELNRLQSDKKTLTAYLQAFNVYQDDPAYDHLFKPIIPDKNGNTYSVHDLLQRVP